MKILIPIALIIIVVVIGLGIYNFLLLCDGLALDFKRVYEGSGQDLYKELSDLAKQNTEIIQDCRAVDYVKSPRSELHKWLGGRDIDKYAVRFSCDILDFEIEIYKKGNNYYLMFSGLGPCWGENVYFDDHPGDNPVGGRFYTKYIFEDNVIQNNLDNFDFCVELDKRTRAEDEYNKDFCYKVKAENTEDTDEAISYCDQIKWTPIRIDCYRWIIEPLRYSNPNKALELCNKLDAQIPEDDPYKRGMEDFCF